MADDPRKAFPHVGGKRYLLNFFNHRRNYITGKSYHSLHAAFVQTYLPLKDAEYWEVHIFDMENARGHSWIAHAIDLPPIPCGMLWTESDLFHTFCETMREKLTLKKGKTMAQTLFPNIGSKRFQVNYFDRNGKYVTGDSHASARDAFTQTYTALHTGTIGTEYRDIVYAVILDTAREFSSAWNARPSDLDLNRDVLWDTFRARMDI